MRGQVLRGDLAIADRRVCRRLARVEADQPVGRVGLVVVVATVEIVPGGAVVRRRPRRSAVRGGRDRGCQAARRSRALDEAAIRGRGRVVGIPDQWRGPVSRRQNQRRAAAASLSASSALSAMNTGTPSSRSRSSSRSRERHRLHFRVVRDRAVADRVIVGQQLPEGMRARRARHSRDTSGQGPRDRRRRQRRREQHENADEPALARRPHRQAWSRTSVPPSANRPARPPRRRRQGSPRRAGRRAASRPRRPRADRPARCRGPAAGWREPDSRRRRSACRARASRRGCPRARGSAAPRAGGGQRRRAGNARLWGSSSNGARDSISSGASSRPSCRCAAAIVERAWST